MKTNEYYRKMFLRFLEDQCLMEKVENHSIGGIPCKDSVPEDFLMDLFFFEYTEEGAEFWWKQHSEWILCLKEDGYHVPENYG